MEVLSTYIFAQCPESGIDANRQGIAPITFVSLEVV